MRGWVVAWVLVAGLGGGSARPGDEPPAPPLVWERPIPRGAGEPRFAPDGSCLAVATATGITLLTRTGAVVWEQPSPNRWLRPDALAVAAGCKWVAAGGDAGYRYVWLLDDRGQGRRAIATHGTPRGLAFSRDATVLAIGTAAGQLQLADVRGESATEHRFDPPGTVVEGLAFAPDGQLFVTDALGFVGRLGRDGTPGWTWGAQWTHAVTDRTFDRLLVVDAPPHFSDIDGVALLTGAGQVLWQTRLHEAQAALAPDGTRAVVNGAPVSADDQGNTHDDPPRVAITLDRDGHETDRRPVDPGQLIALSPDGRCRITLHVGLFHEPGREHDSIACHPDTGEPLWRLDDVPAQPPTFSPDGTLMLVHTDEALRAYDVQGQPARR